jgi:maleate isomerase
MFISCVAFHTIEVIEKLEEELNKPVITSNQATMWLLLRLAHIDDEIKGYGKLLQY